MTVTRRVFIAVALVIVTLAVVAAPLLMWNNQKAAAVNAETCEKGGCAACVELPSCCADAEDVHKELGNV